MTAFENNIPDDMKEITQFLIRNELQHLKEKFEVEEITIPALLQMDDADLKEIGIKKGPRVLLLAAAKELQEKTGNILYLVNRGCLDKFFLKK